MCVKEKKELPVKPDSKNTQLFSLSTNNTFSFNSFYIGNLLRIVKSIGQLVYKQTFQGS